MFYISLKIQGGEGWPSALFTQCASQYKKIDHTICVGTDIAYRLTMDFFRGKVYLEFCPDGQERKEKSVDCRKNLLNFFTHCP